MQRFPYFLVENFLFPDVGSFNRSFTFSGSAGAMPFGDECFPGGARRIREFSQKSINDVRPQWEGSGTDSCSDVSEIGQTKYKISFLWSFKINNIYRLKRGAARGKKRRKEARNQIITKEREEVQE